MAHVTLRDVAARAGVHHTTVSLALRGHPRIPSQTRERIRTLAEAMGYRPNPLVAALMSQTRSGRTQTYQETLGIILGDPPVMKSRWARACLGGIEQRAQTLGYKINSFPHPKPADISSLTRVLHARGIHGLILFPPPPPYVVPALPWSQFSAVVFGFQTDTANLHSVSHHHFHGMTQILWELDRRGYQRIGIFETPICDGRPTNPYRAALACYQQTIAEERRVPHLLTEHLDESAFQLFRKWVEQHQLDALVGDAKIAWSYLVRMGLDSARKLGYVVDDWHEGDPFAGIQQFDVSQGATAVDVIVEQLQQNERGIPVHPKTVLIKGAFVDGKSILTRAPESRTEGEHHQSRPRRRVRRAAIRQTPPRTNAIPIEGSGTAVTSA